MSQYLLNKRLYGPQHQSRRFGEEKISCIYRKSNHDPSFLSP